MSKTKEEKHKAVVEVVTEIGKMTISDLRKCAHLLAAQRGLRVDMNKNRSMVTYLEVLRPGAIYPESSEVMMEPGDSLRAFWAKAIHWLASQPIEGQDKAG